MSTSESEILERREIERTDHEAIIREAIDDLNRFTDSVVAMFKHREFHRPYDETSFDGAFQPISQAEDPDCTRLKDLGKRAFEHRLQQKYTLSDEEAATIDKILEAGIGAGVISDGVEEESIEGIAEHIEARVEEYEEAAEEFQQRSKSMRDAHPTGLEQFEMLADLLEHRISDEELLTFVKHIDLEHRIEMFCHIQNGTMVNTDIAIQAASNSGVTLASMIPAAGKRLRPEANPWEASIHKATEAHNATHELLVKANDTVFESNKILTGSVMANMQTVAAEVTAKLKEASEAGFSLIERGRKPSQLARNRLKSAMASYSRVQGSIDDTYETDLTSYIVGLKKILDTDPAQNNAKVELALIAGRYPLDEVAVRRDAPDTISIMKTGSGELEAVSKKRRALNIALQMMQVFESDDPHSKLDEYMQDYQTEYDIHQAGYANYDELTVVPSVDWLLENGDIILAQTDRRLNRLKDAVSILRDYFTEEETEVEETEEERQFRLLEEAEARGELERGETLEEVSARLTREKAAKRAAEEIAQAEAAARLRSVLATAARSAEEKRKEEEAAQAAQDAADEAELERLIAEEEAENARLEWEAKFLEDLEFAEENGMTINLERPQTSDVAWQGMMERSASKEGSDTEKDQPERLRELTQSWLALEGIGGFKLSWGKLPRNALGGSDAYCWVRGLRQDGFAITILTSHKKANASYIVDSNNGKHSLEDLANTASRIELRDDEDSPASYVVHRNASRLEEYVQQVVQSVIEHAQKEKTN